MSATGRLRSDSKVENIFGILYYAMLIAIPGLAIAFMVAFNLGLFSDNIVLWCFLLATTYLFIFTNILTLKDYYKQSNVHKGTIEFFLSKINITKPKGLANIFGSFDEETKEAWEPAFIAIGVASCFFAIGSIVTITVDGNYSFLIVFLYNTFLIALSIFINGDVINDKKVPSELLELMLEMKNIHESEKTDFLRKVRANIVRNGYITRREVFEACSEILVNQERLKQIKNKELEKEKYTNFLNKTK
jgi:hypothetical protein